jgi:hypothetical protein
MRKTPSFLLAIAVASGCVVYDEQLVYDDPAGPPGVDDGNDPVEVPDDADLIDALAFLEPSFGLAGSTVIVSLQGELDPYAIEGVRFFGPSDLGISSMVVRDDEVLLALNLAEGCTGQSVALGDYDLLVELADGTAVFVTAGFEVVSTLD